MYVYTTLERSEGCPLQHPAEAAPSVDLSFRLGKKRKKKCFNNYFYSVNYPLLSAGKYRLFSLSIKKEMKHQNLTTFRP